MSARSSNTHPITSKNATASTPTIAHNTHVRNSSLPAFDVAVAVADAAALELELEAEAEAAAVAVTDDATVVSVELTMVSDADVAETAPVVVAGLVDPMLNGLPLFVMLRRGGAKDVDQAGVELRVMFAVLRGGKGAGMMPLGVGLMQDVTGFVEGEGV